MGFSLRGSRTKHKDKDPRDSSTSSRQLLKAKSDRAHHQRTLSPSKSSRRDRRSTSPVPHSRHSSSRRPASPKRHSTGTSSHRRYGEREREGSNRDHSASSRRQRDYSSRSSAHTRSASSRYSQSSRRKSRAKSRSSNRTSIRVSVADFMCKTTEDFKDKYNMGEVLYKGEFCRIHACEHKLTRTQRVVKVVYKESRAISPEEDVTAEMNTDHSNSIPHPESDECIEFEIMRHLDTTFVPKIYKMYDQDQHQLIVMERCYGSNLQTELAYLGSSLDESTCRTIMWQILSCLNYLHDSAHVVHSDLRPCNILLDQDHDFSKIKIIDFDEAVLVEEPLEKVREKRGLGTGVDVIYQAPELHGKRPKFNSKADLWSCGILLYHMLYRRYPFVSEHSIRASVKDTGRDVIKRMTHSRLKFPKEPEVSKEAKDLMTTLLRCRHRKRPNAAKALQHKWFAMEKQNQHSSRRTLDTPLPDKDVQHQQVARLAQLQKHNPNSRLKQAVCAIIAAELLTKEEHAKVDSVFQQLDILKDGKLRPKEVKAAFMLSLGIILTEDDLEDIFNRCDSNRNGSLDFSEFAVASMPEKELMSDVRLQQVFRRFDRHKRGYIGTSELRAIPAFAAHSNDQLEFVIAEVDVRGQGQISFEDFAKLMKAGAVY